MKKFCIWGFILGALLVTLAALLIVYTDHSDGTITASQRLRLERTVSQLDGCATCHDTPDTAGAGQVTLVVVPEPAGHSTYIMNVLMQQDASSDALPQIPETVRAEMHDIGQRILDLPATDAAQVDAVTADFLVAYDAAAAGVTTDWQSTLDALGAIERQLRTLEHQAHPVKLAAATGSNQAPDAVDVWLTSTQSPLPVAWSAQAALVIIVTSHGAWVPDQDAQTAVRVMAYDVQRRGPPAAFDNMLDSLG